MGFGRMGTATIKDVIRHSIGSPPSLPKILLSSTMVFGWTETDAVTDRQILYLEKGKIEGKL